MKKIYLLSGLDCPHCAEKIEREVAAIDDVESAKLNLLKQTLTVKSDTDLLAKIKEIVRSHEPEVSVHEKAHEREHSHNHEHCHQDEKSPLPRIIIGAALFAFSLLLDGIFESPFILFPFIAAYIILGYDVLLRAGKNIIKGRVLDENFLMSISTVGAFLIGEVPEAVAVMLFYQVGEYFQSRAVQSSRKSIKALLAIRPDSATVLRGGEQITLSPDEVMVGEKILIKPGEKIALDGVISEGESTVNTAALTGESLPRGVKPGDDVLCGFVNLNGVITVEVTRPAGESTAAKVIELVENAADKKAHAERFITRFARYYTPAVVIVALLLGTVPPLIWGNFADWLNRAFVFLVISCPCALVLSVPLAFFGGIGAASSRGILIKGGNYLEALSRANTVVFDKTGTLTKGEFRVTRVIAENAGEGELLALAAKAEHFSNHPLAASVRAFCNIAVDEREIKDYKEISGRGVCAYIDGKTVLCGNRALLLENNIPVPEYEETGSTLFLSRDGVYLGLIMLEDEIKENSEKTISRLSDFGIKKTAMLTGDIFASAQRVKEKLKIGTVFAELLPDGKVKKLEEMKTNDSTIIFVGDGINDAPCLALADVGVAMGGLGSDAAISAADVVLMNDDPYSLCDALKIAKDTRRIVIENIVFSLAVKGLFLLFGALGIASMWLAVFGDVGVALLAVLNSLRILKK